VPPERRDAARLVETEGPVRHVLAGPVRVDVTGDALAPADDITTDTLTIALHAARGWIFVTRRGDVYRSDTFTGRLRPLRALWCDTAAGTSPVAFESRRRVVVMSADARAMLWSDGDALHAVDVPGAVAMAWQSESRGAVIVGYRTLRATRDGGRTWRDVDLGAALPLAVIGREGGLYVDTTEGTRLLDARDALTPAALADDPWMLPLMRGVESVYERGYARAPAPIERCAHAPEPATVNAWNSPHLIAYLPTRRTEGMALPSAPRGAPSPFGTLRGRAFADTRNVPAVVSITRPDDPAVGHPVALAWRGEDERGAFTVRVQTRAPVEVPVRAHWAVVAATRVGLLCAIPALAPGATADDNTPAASDRALFWFTAAGVRRLSVGLTAASSISALALDDGGLMLLGRTERPSRPFAPGPAVVLAIALAPDGSVRAQRSVVDASMLRWVVGLGERGGRWGIVTAEHATPDALTFLALDGADEPYGAWAFAMVPAVCGARDATAPRLHLFHRDDEGNEHGELSATLGPQFDGPEYAYARLATFERGARGATCVRRVWGVRQIGDAQDADGSYVDDLWGAFRLTARGGRLVAVSDDAHTVATFPMTLRDNVGFLQQY
jgi:hypothetical protein